MRWNRLVQCDPHHAAAPSSVIPYLNSPGSRLTIYHGRYRLILSRYYPDVGEVEGKATYLLNRPSPLMGLSATFSILRGIRLGSVFQSLLYHRDFLETIQQRWSVNNSFRHAIMLIILYIQRRLQLHSSCRCSRFQRDERVSCMHMEGESRCE